VNTLIWRLHRTQLNIVSAAVAALAVILLISGILMARDYHHFLATCAARNTCDRGGLLFIAGSIITDLIYFVTAVPLLFGLFWGAPLLAREFEDGTHILAWTQGITRRSWLTRNTIWALSAAAVWGAAIAALTTWWRTPENALSASAATYHVIGAYPDNRFAIGLFDIQGIVPVAYSVFAVALGIAASVIFRRVVPAMAATLVVFGGLRYLIGFFARPHYISAISKAIPLARPDQNAAPHGARELSQVDIGPGGRNFSASGITQTTSPLPATSAA
jgi:hypothetical protein